MRKDWLRKLYKYLFDDPDQPVMVDDLWRNDAVKKLFESFLESNLKDVNGAIIIWTKINDDGLHVDFSGLDQLRAAGACHIAEDLIAEQKVRRLD